MAIGTIVEVGQQRVKMASAHGEGGEEIAEVNEVYEVLLHCLDVTDEVSRLPLQVEGCKG